MSAPQPRGLKKPTAQKKPVQVKSRTELQKLKLHTGPIDQRALSTKGPAELLDETVGVLQSMGLLIEKTGSPYKLVVIRPETTKEVEVYSTPVSDLTKKTSLLSIGSSKTRKKANYLSSFPVSFVKQIKYFAQFGSGYNNGYDGSTKTDPTEGKIMMEKKEIRMNLYINRIKNLDGLVIVDLKRLRGDIWQFKALYNELILKLSSNTPGYHFEE
jgi:protein-serine/threonine kinase